jgi:hypothetical protein
MGVLYTHSPKSPGPSPKLPKIIIFLNKKISKKFELSRRRRCRPAACGRLLVPGSPVTSGRRLKVGGPGPAGDQRSPAGRGPTPEPLGQFPFFLKCFFFLPSTFCASGQLLLVGSSTCPPCPDFSLKLQTPITFDP